MTWRECWQYGKRRASRWVLGDERAWESTCCDYATAAVLIVSAVATAATTYAASEQAAAAQDAQSKAAKAQAAFARQSAEIQAQDEESAAKAQEQIAKARRAAVEDQARRMLRSQGSKAGAAGVVAHEGSLLENELEVASLAQLNAQNEEYGPLLEAQALRAGADRTRYRGELSGRLNDYQSLLFKNTAQNTRFYGTIATGLSLAGSAASAYGRYGSVGSTSASTAGGFSSSTGYQTYRAGERATY